MSPDRFDLPVLLLTRPEPGNTRVLAECEAAFGGAIPAVLSPVLEIVPVGPWPDLSRYASALLTSVHGVRGDLSGKRAYCVGSRTARVAAAAGASVDCIVPDADSLMRKDLNPDLPMVYLRGAHVSTDLAAHFGCEEQVVYDQVHRPLSKPALDLIGGERRVILPLFSPRSARLVAKEIPKDRPGVTVIAMSDAVARAWQEARSARDLIDICSAPTQAEMVSRIVASLRNT
ncbi:uroporphyrinogen-III synthase [Aliiroseovarius crassostreae]|uniref:uroporphyrinogen-III synthase n=1 Tax=Aliiroseovarius crassostreae TaxID=154981 RepID=UPI00220C1D7F|nr:uroporphyrinogen-III synthase [Aliiroseovarius crassostreae]UWP98492.1 uroporphyrinogen-III synthase [Aliiroseovarius crassostreae]